MQRLQLKTGISHRQVRLSRASSLGLRSSIHGQLRHLVGKPLGKRAVQQQPRRAVSAVATAEAIRAPAPELSRLDGKLKIIGVIMTHIA